MGLLRCSLALVCCGVVLAGCEDEEEPPQEPPGVIQDNRRLAWEQAGASLDQLREYRFRVYVDGAPAALPGVECGGTTHPGTFACTALLPALTPGSHVVAVSAMVNGVESAPSNVVTVNGTPARAAPAQAVVACIAASSCFDVSLILTTPATVSAPLATPDGRLWFIEDGRFVRVISDGGLVPAPALTVPHDGVRFTALLADRSFEKTRVIRVARVDDSDARRRSVTIAAFRESGLRLGDAATVVSPIPLPPDGDPQVAEDREGRIYVAIPAARDRSRRGDVWAGAILRLTADGRVPWSAGQRSPLWAQGLERPTALTVDATDGHVWIGGRQAGLVTMRALRFTGETVRSSWLGLATGAEFESLPDLAALMAVGLRGTALGAHLAGAQAGWLDGAADMARLGDLARAVFGASRAVAAVSDADGRTYIVTRASAPPHVHRIHRVTWRSETPRPQRDRR